MSPPDLATAQAGGALSKADAVTGSALHRRRRVCYTPVAFASGIDNANSAFGAKWAVGSPLFLFEDLRVLSNEYGHARDG